MNKQTLRARSVNEAGELKLNTLRCLAEFVMNRGAEIPDKILFSSCLLKLFSSDLFIH